MKTSSEAGAWWGVAVCCSVLQCVAVGIIDEDE